MCEFGLCLVFPKKVRHSFRSPAREEGIRTLRYHQVVLKSVISWILGGVTILAVIAAAIAYYDLPPGERQALWHNVGRVAVWLGLMLVLPWATFFFSTAAARRDSNAAGVLLVAGYVILDAILLWLLVGVPSGTFLILSTLFGLLVALTYTLLTCDWIAERNA